MRTKSKLGLLDWVARALVAACVLNLNGVGSMMFNQGGLVSLLMLVAAAVLVIATGRYAWSLPFAALMIAVASYLLLSSIFYDPSLSIEEPAKYYRAYGGALLILWGVVGYVASLRAGANLEEFLRYLRNILLLSAASVWASPILYEYYVNLPFSHQSRMGGFFGNPNEAAMVSTLAVALSLAVPYRRKSVQLVALLVASAAVFMTFSKTGMSCLIIILAWYLLRNAKGIGLVFIPLVALASVMFVQAPEDVLLAVAEHPFLNLDNTQQRRILALGEIFSGQINEDTSTGRTYLWLVAVDMAWQHFPFGSGLGSAHHIIGGTYELDTWQGAHNTFLMVWAEGGILPAMLLVAAIAVTATRSVRHPLSAILLPCLFVLLAQMVAGHTSLGLRYHNVMLAVIIGFLTSWSSRREKWTLLMNARQLGGTKTNL